MDLKLDDFLYELPEGKIAKHPLKNRADSKLLHYHQGEINHHTFDSITDLVPQGSLLMFNNTRVIPARVIMYKDTGAKIEIFLLEPLLPSTVHEEVMSSQGSSTWRCMIGNAKKWKMDTSLIYDEIGLKATRISENQVKFEWGSDMTFSELLIQIGKIPLPPYINREPEKSDEERYQTVYSKMQGAVAAPTAGLHFTDDIISVLEKKKVQTDYLTLHVSAGTFQPIKEQKISKHPMHNEQIWVSRQNVEYLLSSNKIIAVGTTAMRTIESLYWYGIKLLHADDNFLIKKEDAYTLQSVSKEKSLEAILNYMSKHSLTTLQGQTEIFIYPSYEFRLCQGLVTNFHLPGSTLILLVAAFIGEDWRNVYDNALANNYRFLSYGDSSLLIP